MNLNEIKKMNHDLNVTLAVLTSDNKPKPEETIPISAGVLSDICVGLILLINNTERFRDALQTIFEESDDPGARDCANSVLKVRFAMNKASIKEIMPIQWVMVEVIREVGYHDDHRVGEIINIDREHLEDMITRGYVRELKEVCHEPRRGT